MTIEGGLYHDSQYDRSRPVGGYWEAHGGPDPAGLAPLAGDVAAEVAIVGGGYTGLSAAYHLAREHGIQAVVLEAGRIGWGASGRNGGFCGPGGTKLGYATMASRWGIQEARRFFDAQLSGGRLVRSLAADERFDLEIAGEGEHYVAHRPGRWHELENYKGTVQRLFGERWELWRKAEMEERLLRSPEAHGCLVVPHYFGFNPMRYVRGLAAATSARGARLHPETPVTAWQHADGKHRLVTPGGVVTAGRVLFATNGYTPEGLDPMLAGRLLPALSSIIVTRPLTAAERTGSWPTAGCCSARAAGSTPRSRLSPRAAPGWSGAWARSSRPGAASRSTMLGGGWSASRAICCRISAGWMRARRCWVPGPITAVAPASGPCSAGRRRRASPGARPTRPCPSSC